MSSVASDQEIGWGQREKISVETPKSTFPGPEQTPGPPSPLSQPLKGRSLRRGKKSDSSTLPSTDFSVISSASSGVSSNVPSIVSSVSSVVSSKISSIASSRSSILSRVLSGISSKGSTATSIPIEVLRNVTGTRILNTTMSGPPRTTLFTRLCYDPATRFVSQLWHDVHALLTSPTPLFWALFVLSAPLVLYAAWLVTHSRTFTAYFESRTNAARARHTYPRLWNTRDHWVLSSLVSVWLRGRIPGDGMWKRDNARSLRAKEDKSALQKLVRMGIYPLFIQDGGLQTTAEQEGGLSAWGWPTWPLWKQSKKRAVFEFVVPRARGWTLEDEDIEEKREKQRRKVDDKYMRFVFHLCNSKRLRRAARWRVAVSGETWVDDPNTGEQELRLGTLRSKVGPDHRVPWEIGALSRIRALLPFKADRILRRGARTRDRWADVTNWLNGTRLLTSIHVPVVRIEAPDSQYIELDKEVLLIAQESGLDTDWDETMANFELRKAYRRVDLDPTHFLPDECLLTN